MGGYLSRTILGKDPKLFHAEWKQYGKAAGLIRNRQIAEYCDVGLVLWDRQSPGTKDVLKQLLSLGKPVILVYI